MKTRRSLIVSTSILLFLTACMGNEKLNPMLDGTDKTFILQGVSELQQITQLTGVQSMNATERYVVYGTDLGSMINEGDRTYFVFGDTFGERNPTLTGAGGNLWRSNVIAYSTDRDPEDGITFDGMITDEFGIAKELLPSAKKDYEEMTKIPTHGVYANNALYLYYMSVKHWGAPGQWDSNYSSIAKSTDQGQNWTLMDEIKWTGDSNFIQVSPYKVETKEGNSDVYFWCIPSGRFGGVKLMKVNEASIENLADYRYYAGTDNEGEPIWDADLSMAELVVEDRVGELSVIWNSFLGRWLMTYSVDGDVVIREGLAPWGPWGEAIEVVKAGDYPGLYAPYMNDRYLGEDGRTLYFSLSLWDPYNVFWFKASLDLLD